ncbi:MAG: DUF4115 domain-containing protein [Selenomonadaceae bacterium]|nr:DUF4115 domain-containing protein [Selenomonadaceae bacterium]
MLGNKLREERERQNLSVEDIEQGTSIRALYIEAIENGEYDKLPGEVYTRGFIKNYAKFLGLDGDAFSKEFTVEVHGAPPPPSVNEIPAGNPADILAEIPVEKPRLVKPAEPVKPVEPVKPAKPEKKSTKVVGEIRGENRGSSGMLIVAAVVIIAALAGGAWSFLSGDGGDVATNNPPAQTQQQPEQPKTPVANANPAPPPAPIDGVKVDAKFTDRCWTLVTVDGAVVLEGVVEAGENLSWEGKNNISLRLGNAGAVDLTHNGQNLGIQGGIGDVVDKTFTKQ